MSEGISATVAERRPYTEYKVRHWAGCVLIFGDVPLSALQALTKLHPSRSAVMDPELARMAGANMAFGLPQENDALRASLAPAAMRAAQQRLGGRGLSPAAIAWVGGGERGQSSEAIFERLTGMRLGDEPNIEHPHDPDDLRRCLLLLEACPELADKFDVEMPGVSPQWAALVAVWTALRLTLEREVPQWRAQTRGYTPQTYNLMKQALGR